MSEEVEDAVDDLEFAREMLLRGSPLTQVYIAEALSAAETLKLFAEGIDIISTEDLEYLDKVISNLANFKRGFFGIGGDNPKKIAQQLAKPIAIGKRLYNFYKSKEPKEEEEEYEEEEEEKRRFENVPIPFPKPRSHSEEAYNKVARLIALNGQIGQIKSELELYLDVLREDNRLRDFASYSSGVLTEIFKGLNEEKPLSAYPHAIEDLKSYMRRAQTEIDKVNARTRRELGL